MSTPTKPNEWPDTLRVFDNGGSLDGLAVDPYGDDPIGCVAACLDQTGPWEFTAEEMWNEDQSWAEVEWNEERGCYFREQVEGRDRIWVYERRHYPSDLTYFAEPIEHEED